MNNDKEGLRKNLFIIIPSEVFSSILAGEETPLDQENLHHIRKVLRMSGEFPVNVSPGDGRVLPCKLDSRNMLWKSIAEAYYSLSRVPVSVLTAGIKKKNLELMVKKLAEAGAKQIIFVKTDYQNYPVEKADRYDKILVNACEQSRNPLIPEIIHSNQTLIEFPYNDHTLYLWGDPSSDFSLKKLDKSQYQGFVEICYINGPEGGWSPNEENFLKNRFRSIRLSRNVLRSETAALAAVLGIKQMTEDLEETC